MTIVGEPENLDAAFTCYDNRSLVEMINCTVNPDIEQVGEESQESGALFIEVEQSSFRISIEGMEYGKGVNRF